MKIAHVINPVEMPSGHELMVAQPITYETMRRAKKFSSRIELWAVGYEEDEAAFPRGFERCENLTRSILDIKNFKVPRKLPLFKDILDAVYKASDADYIIQTNVDICLMPHFYESVKRFIEMGYDALVINKRLISPHYKKVEEIPEMYCDLGRDHNGCDCFVFKRSDYPDYDLGDICMGTPWSETTLVANMIIHSERFEKFVKPHLTFHIGDSRTWLHKDLADYRQHNTEEFAKFMIYDQKYFSTVDPLGHDTLRWFVQKLKGELEPHYSKECHELCSKVAMLF